MDAASILYVVILVVRVAMFPDMPPIHIDTFETYTECREAGAKLDKSTRIILTLTCEIDT